LFIVTGDKPYIHFQVQRKVIPGGFKDGKKVPPTAVLIYEGKEYNKLIDLMKVSVNIRIS
jgi:hypothetical protein